MSFFLFVFVLKIDCFYGYVCERAYMNLCVQESAELEDSAGSSRTEVTGRAVNWLVCGLGPNRGPLQKQ